MLALPCGGLKGVMTQDRFRREAPIITIASLGIPLDLFRDSPRWRPDIAMREEARGERKPKTAVEYEYRCAEYEYEYDVKRSAAMLGFYFVLSPLLRTVLVLVLVLAAPPIPR